MTVLPDFRFLLSLTPENAWMFCARRLITGFTVG